MKLYIFRCRTRPNMFGATRYETASNLPTQKCSSGWEFFQRVDLTPRGTLRYAVDTGTVRRHIEQRGWHVWDETRDGDKDAAATKPSPRDERQPAAPQRNVANASSDLSAELLKVKLEEVLNSTTDEQPGAYAEAAETVETSESRTPAEEVVESTPRTSSPRDYNYVRSIADLLSSNPPPVKPRPVEKPSRVPVESRVPAESRSPVGSRTPVEGRAAVERAPVESRVPAEGRAPVGSKTPVEGRPAVERAPVESRVPVESRSPVGSRTPVEGRAPVERTPVERPTRTFVDEPALKPKVPAQHQVVWFDIPVRDIDRAIRFYSAVLGKSLKKEQAGPGAAIVMLPHDEGSIGGSLVQSIDAKPSDSGPLLYLNTDGRLEEVLNAVEKHGGRVLAEAHSIAPFGYRAIVLDSEGNRIALHSM